MVTCRPTSRRRSRSPIRSFLLERIATRSASTRTARSARPCCAQASRSRSSRRRATTRRRQATVAQARRPPRRAQAPRSFRCRRWRRCHRSPTPASLRRMAADRGQYVAYTVYRVDPAWRRLPIDERAAGKEAFADAVDEFTPRFEHLRAYSCAGIRPDCDFFLWKITGRYDALGGLAAALSGTPIAGWLETPYSYLSTTKAWQYTSARKPRKIVPRNSPYLVVYPFVKVRPWYALPQEERQRAMDEHIRIGAEFASIHNHTTYSFGIDDQEFMTAFECDEPADFMHLMLTLRDSEASRYTERDTPIFVGQHVNIRSALDALDGAAARVEA